MEQTGKTLSLLGTPRWKGTATHNGGLLKLHDNSFTAGYSSLATAATVNAKFGFGAWYDSSAKNNAISTVRPASNAVFAGILIRQPHIASGYPAQNDEIHEYNKALLCKEGFITYKTGFNASTGAEDQTFTDMAVGMGLFINHLNGRQHFAADLATVAGHTQVGKVIMVNPDDLSVTVKVTL